MGEPVGFERVSLSWRTRMWLALVDLADALVRLLTLCRVEPVWAIKQRGKALRAWSDRRKQEARKNLSTQDRALIIYAEGIGGIGEEERQRHNIPASQIFRLVQIGALVHRDGRYYAPPKEEYQYGREA